jgi:arsenite-transporting ATPase
LWVDRHIDTDGRTYTLTMPLPLASANELELARHGDELIVTVGSYRRVLPLPAALARGVVAGARLDDGRLQVRFAPKEVARPVTSDVPGGTGPLESAQELAQGLTAEYHEHLARREAVIGENR